MVLRLLDPQNLGPARTSLAVGVAAALSIAPIGAPRLGRRHGERVQTTKQNRPDSESHGVYILHSPALARRASEELFLLCWRVGLRSHCTFGVVSSITLRRCVLATTISRARL